MYPTGRKHAACGTLSYGGTRAALPAKHISPTLELSPQESRSMQNPNKPANPPNSI